MKHEGQVGVAGRPYDAAGQADPSGNHQEGGANPVPRLFGDMSRGHLWQVAWNFLHWLP